MPALPIGTVTFLFTDIEGSTQLWENQPEAMRDALATHDAILKGAIEQNEGCLVKTTGDGVLAAFRTATDALNAAFQAQRELWTRSWPDPLEIRVRMGLHTGAAEYRDGDYFGPALNRAARLMAAGHGGQILLSAVTQELCRDALPNEVSLLRLGEFRLKDLNRPETIFQVGHPALPSAFAPLRTLDNPGLPNNLPVQTTSFIGREKECREVRDLLAKTRLLTLMGTGGGGKTRLSLQVAADLLDAFPDGVWQVELAAITDPALMPQAVAQAIGIREQSGQPILQTLLEHLKSRSLLVLLDNCEHLIDACAQLASALLKTCPAVKILATSRERLGIAGELTYRLPSLSVPPPTLTATPEALSPFESVQLFIERALFHKPDFAVTNRNAAAVAQLCHRLDGIPLALELAAARVRSLTVEDINSRLDQRFRLLTGGDRSALPRQQTLRALVDWSYDLLRETEKVLLARLSVFAGGWTPEAAESVCGFDPIEDWEVLDLLTGLVDRSLVVADTHEEGTRYRMLETIRQYGREKRDASGEGDLMRTRHSRFYLDFSEELFPRLRGPEQGSWLARLEREHDNLRAALELFAARAVAGDRETAEGGVRMAAALAPFWDIHGHLTEGRERLRIALEGSADVHSVARASALRAAGRLAYRQGDYDLAFSSGEQSLLLSRELEDRQGMGNALTTMGLAAWSRGDLTHASTLYEEALTLLEEVGDRVGMADALLNRALIVQDRGEYEKARALYERSLALYREQGHSAGVANALLNMGNLARSRDDYEAAGVLYEESLALSRAAGNKVVMAFALVGLGAVAHEKHDLTSAAALFAESIALYRELGNKPGVAYALVSRANTIVDLGEEDEALSLYRQALSLARGTGSLFIVIFGLEGLASVLLKQRDQEKAIHLWAVAFALRERTGIPLSPSHRSLVEEKLAMARVRLGEDTYTAAWAKGASLDEEQAIAYALDEVGLPS